MDRMDCENSLDRITYLLLYFKVKFDTVNSYGGGGRATF